MRPSCTVVPKSCGHVLIWNNNLLNFLFMPFVNCMDIRICGIKKMGLPSFPLLSRAYLHNSFPDRWTGCSSHDSCQFNHTWLSLYGLAQSQEHFESCRKKLNGLAQPSRQQLWWLLFSQLLITVNCTTKLWVTLNTCVRFANSKSASFGAHNG